MRSLAELLYEDQEQLHRKLANFLFYPGIFAVLFALLIFLSWFHIGMTNLFTIDFVWLFAFAMLVYYYLLDIRLAGIMTVIVVGLAILAYWLALPFPQKPMVITVIILFIAGLFLQLVSQMIARRRVSFGLLIQQTFTAPICLIAKIAMARGFRADLKTKIIEVSHKKSAANATKL